VLFWLGVHRPHWLAEAGVPLMVSRATLADRRRFPIAVAPWVLDSGAFSQLADYGRWTISAAEYAAEVRRYVAEIGACVWVAPQDWMCEKAIIEGGELPGGKVAVGTGLSVAEHQRRTVANFHELRARLGPLVIPVLQGDQIDDYLRCWELYEAWGHRLDDEPVVGLGSVCRRQDTAEAGRIVRALRPLRLHGFGVKRSGLDRFRDALASADSMAARRRASGPDLMGGRCSHRVHNNCLPWALVWREQVLRGLDQLSLDRLDF
jgi:hypothetical protein